MKNYIVGIALALAAVLPSQSAKSQSIDAIKSKCLNDPVSCSVWLPSTVEVLIKQVENSQKLIGTASCTSNTWEDTAGSISALQIMYVVGHSTVGAVSNAALSGNGNLPLETAARVSGVLEKAYKNARLSAAYSFLELADLAKRSKCFDISDKYYRHVIKVFVGDDMNALRQRAQIGIEDLRVIAK